MDKEKQDKYDKILSKGIDKELKDPKSTISKEEKAEIKAYAIKKALKIKRYVRN